MVCLFAPRAFTPVGKSVSHPPVRSVRFVQVETSLRYVRVSKQIESAMGKDGVIHYRILLTGV